MRVSLTVQAEAELTEALAWYEQHAPAIAPRLLEEFKALSGRLEENPNQFPMIRRDARRASFRRFPYCLFFRVRADCVEVFACFHMRRNPRRWQRHS